MSDVIGALVGGSIGLVVCAFIPTRMNPLIAISKFRERNRP